MNVRRATARDLPAVARTIARAFFEDPAYVAMFPDARTRVDRTTQMLETLLRVVYLPHDEIWVTDDVRACAVWAPPGKWHVPLPQQLRLLPLVRVVRGESLIALRLLYGIEKKHPRTPHHYLALLGVDPDAQGRGLGSAVLRPVLDRCDERRSDAYLESTNPKNHAFYRRHGFVVGDTVSLPAGVVGALMTRRPS